MKGISYKISAKNYLQHFQSIDAANRIFDALVEKGYPRVELSMVAKSKYYYNEVSIKIHKV